MNFSRPSLPRFAAALAILALTTAAHAIGRYNIVDFAPPGTPFDRTGTADDSAALAAVITAANVATAKGDPACVYLPAGTYRIVTPPPAFIRAGCVQGDGPTQTFIHLDPAFAGDLFAWSEAWAVTTPGPVITGLHIEGSRSAPALQNAFVFYDRNDQVFMDNVEVMHLHGRALYSGVLKHTTQSYMRESHLRSLRFFEDGAPGIPVVEFNSQGTTVVPPHSDVRKHPDGTNEIRVDDMDIFGPYGPGVVIRNNSTGAVRTITFNALRIEGWQNLDTHGDLLTIGDPSMHGTVNNIYFTNLELIDPAQGYAAMRLTAPSAAEEPYQIKVDGEIGGGIPRGQGLRIDAGRHSTFRFIAMHTFDTNVVVGPHAVGIVLDGGGQESAWSYSIDPSSRSNVFAPALHVIEPAPPKPAPQPRP